jgi:hypothetical protein
MEWGMVGLTHLERFDLKNPCQSQEPHKRLMRSSPKHSILEQEQRRSSQTLQPLSRP